MEQMKTEQQPGSQVEAPVRMDLKPERIQQLLGDLRGWALGPDGRAIQRIRLFTQAGKATGFARRACRLASKLRQPVLVRIAGTEVTITLTGHPVRGCTGGLTDAVFNLADLIG
ncbi:MAG TPA: 4a-hydroxytetrahydrobiopterin dehydratase [Thermoanaerobaculia bacterium]|nr:4a-hydroxytetrahydrobiopterin dehydratase [Thermoanaerobaculia bacterium]